MTQMRPTSEQKSKTKPMAKAKLGMLASVYMKGSEWLIKPGVNMGIRSRAKQENSSSHKCGALAL